MGTPLKVSSDAKRGVASGPAEAGRSAGRRNRPGAQRSVFEAAADRKPAGGKGEGAIASAIAATASHEPRSRKSDDQQLAAIRGKVRQPEEGLRVTCSGSMTFDRREPEGSR